IRSPTGIAARAFAFARSAAKRLPAAYALADAARAAVLVAEQRRGLTVYHETNHAAPPFSGPVVLTVHDLSTLIVPETEEPARVLAGPLQRLDPTGLEDAVVLGYVRDDELPPLLRGAAAFCYPSRYEGFGLPLLEALACAVPAVASDDPALLEVAGACALQFPRGDVEALTHALTRIIEDTQLRISLIRKGPARAAEFTWERSATAHLAAY